MRLILFIFIISLISCGERTVDIYFPSQFVNENEVIINSDFHLRSDSTEVAYAYVSVPQGKINVSVNGEQQEITTTKGGILNLNKEEFVIFPIIYGTVNSMDILPIYVMVDSTVYYKETSKYNEKFFRENLENGKESSNKINTMNGDLALIKIGKDDFFTEHNWDVSLLEEIPEEVKVYGDAGQAGAVMRVVRGSTFFQVYALMSGEYKSFSMREPEVVEEEMPAEAQ